MSKSIKVQLSKTLSNSKLEILLNSYTSLKSILSPNLSENNNSFMNSIIELITSQLHIFLKLISLNGENQIYKSLNSNNQYLSKQIAYLYEFPRYNINTKISMSTISEKEGNNRIFNKKESYSLEEKRDSNHGNNSDNFEFDFNKNTNSKIEEIDKKDDYYENNNENEEDILENDNDNNLKKNLNIKTPKHFVFKRHTDKFIKINKSEKGKNELIRSLNYINKEKEKEKNIKQKTQKSSKKIVYNSINNIINEKENKTKYKRNIISQKNNITTKKGLNISSKKKYDYTSFQNKNNNIINNQKKLLKNKTYKINNNKTNNDYNKDTLKSKKLNDKSEILNKKFERKQRKSKTVIYQTIQIPYLIDITPNVNNEDHNYISITFSNQILKRIKTPKVLKRRHKSITNNNSKTKNSPINSSFKEINKHKLISPDYFSLDAFLIPHQNGKGEGKIFFTKNGNVLINKDQKDILEDYVNNYLFDEEDNKSSGTEKSVKEKLINDIKARKNKKYVIRGTSKHYNLKDVTDVLQILPNSFNGHINEFYLKKKKASIFDRGIFKICHKVIDNYKKLEGKEDFFGYKKSNSNSKSKNKERKNNNSNKKSYRNQMKSERLFNKIF